MRKPSVAALAIAIGVLGLTAPAAGAKEKVLTLYSPKIQTLPYVHDTHHVTLRADGHEAPAEPGYITGWKEMALVDSKDPDAKPLPIAKMMIHHLLYFAPGTDSATPGSCWGQSGFIGGRGEEHPLGGFATPLPASTRKRYGLVNRKADGTAPDWRLTAMVMNHFKKPKSFYVRTRIHYTTERRTPILPIIVGDCSLNGNGMAYDVPGGGRKGSNFVNATDWVVPEGLNGRLMVGVSHQHGGAKYQALQSLTCKRRIFKASAYHGPPDHVYNTIRPILHEPGPVGNGTFATKQGVPITEGEVLRRVAVHDNHNLHVASMGFWFLFVLPDEKVKPCGKMPTDMVDINRPRRFDRTPNYDLKVPQLAKPISGSGVFDGNPLEIGDDFFRPGTITAKTGETVTWSFAGTRPHNVAVANGPRGFSSLYTGRASGTYSVTPKVKGTYRLVCLVHPTTMAQTLKVE